MARDSNPRRALVAAGLGLLILLGAGCDGGDAAEDPAPAAAPAAGGDLTAVWCPMVPADAGADEAERWQPAEDAFDTAELVGLELEAARALAASHGCDVVVALADGAGQPVPLEIDPTLVYVYTHDDVVDAVEGVGGGL